MADAERKTEYERFKALTRKLVTVPKDEAPKRVKRFKRKKRSRQE